MIKPSIVLKIRNKGTQIKGYNKDKIFLIFIPNCNN